MLSHLPGPSQDLDRRLPQNFKQLAAELIEAIEKKDRYTAGHVKRTAYYAVLIARELPGADQSRLERVRMAAILHDLGKIEIDDSILLKGAPLEPVEWGSMREHPRLGYEILGRTAGLEEVSDGVRFHHERWDGQGYPDGLSGAQIPWIARLIAVADAYDAMVSTRPYRKGMDRELACREIVRQSGTQFDPEIVAAFERALG